MTSETADATAPVHPYYAPEPDSAWARVDRHDAPLPRMVLDGVLQARFAGGLCQACRLWWHSQPAPP